LQAVKRILVLGGYGNFGKRIVESLALENIQLLIAGRNIQRGQELVQQLSSKAKADLEAVAIDIQGDDFVAQLKRLNIDILIHTSGPFQGQAYTVPRACIAVGCHYIDLADDRRFVCDISSLQQEAQEKDVLLVSGASSVPGLSSVVVDYFLPEFQRLDSIDFAIAPGNRAERGEATVAAILSYTGHPIDVFDQGRWQPRYGWMNSGRRDFNRPVGKRYLANVDIPDLELFPRRYPQVKVVRFQAGLELAVLHYGMVAMALMVKLGWVKSWQPYAGLITKLSRYFEGFGSDDGAMQICLQGLDLKAKAVELEWTLTAEDGIGPYIPIMSAIILAKKLIRNELMQRGAMPCLGLYSLADFEREVSQYKIYHNTVRRPV